MKSNKLTRGLYASAAVLMMLSPVVGTMAGTIAGNFGTQVVTAAGMTLTINKYGAVTPPDDHVGKYVDANDHAAIDNATKAGVTPTGYKPVANVPFKIMRVEPAAGKTLKDINPNDASTYHIVETLSNVTTGTDGKASATINNKGVYVVEELASPGVDVTKVQKSLIQMPLPIVDASGNTTYRYDVNIYPKNELDNNNVLGGMKKTINREESDLVLGGEITWDLEYKVPASAFDASGNVTAKGLEFTDPVDKRVTDLTIKGYVVDATGGKEELTEQTTTPAVTGDFEVSKVESGDTDGNTVVSIKMTNDGIKKGKDKTIVFKLKGKISSLGEKDATTGQYPVLTNKFTTTYTPSTNVPDTGTTDPEKPEVKTEFGQIDIKKVSSESDQTVLAGAKFEVYYDDEAHNAVKVADKEIQNSKNEGTDVLTIETGADGLGHVYGLEKGKTYYLKEIKAPEGYKLSDEKFPVEVGADSAVDAVITNDVDPIYNFIPMTGSQRRIALMAMGATLAVGSMIYVYATKRKKDEDEA